MSFDSWLLLYLSSQFHIASRMGFGLLPRYYTRGGTSAYTSQTFLYTLRISPLTRLSTIMTAGRTIMGRVKRSSPTGPILENAGLKTDDSGAIAPKIGRAHV